MTPEQIEAERKRFEAWMVERDVQLILFCTYEGGKYQDIAVQLAWQAWLEACKPHPTRSTDEN